MSVESGNTTTTNSENISDHNTVAMVPVKATSNDADEGVGAAKAHAGNTDIDIEASKMTKNDDGSVKTTTIMTTTTTTAMANEPNASLNNEKDVVAVNGENHGKVSKITPAQLLAPKQQDRAAAGEDGATGQGNDNASNAGKMENDAALINFKMLYVVTQLCGLTMIVLMGSWIGVHMGGLGGTDNPSLEFNWHPLLMTIGLIFLYGNSILIYRGFRTTRKKTLKITHATIHMGAFILTVIALKTVFDSHNLPAKPIPNMYSLHSWLGLSAVIIFCMQYVAGFMAYMVPGLREQYKIAYMPLHIYFGLFGFVLAIASALMGITEKAIFAIPNYSTLPNSGVMVNICGVLFVIFGGLVVYLTTEPAYKRKPIPEDAVLLTGANE